MAKQRTGTVRAHNGRWEAKYTLASGKRGPWTPLPGDIPPEDTPENRAAAQACAARFAPAVYASSQGEGAPTETVAGYASRWLAQRAPRTRRDNESHLTHHVLPILGPVPMAGLSSAHGDELVASLDAKIAAGKMSDKTARNVWGTVRRMLRDAAHAKPATGLRCLESNPFRDVLPPERSRVTRGKQFLYPSELLSLMSCPDVPARWKRNVAIATYLGLRDGEQRALRWPNVDLEHGVVHVRETTSQGEAREGTKTDAARAVPIPPTLLPLLEAMHDEAGGEGLVCRGIASQRAMARGLRTWLRKAGVTRAALFESTSINLNLRWHDLRATAGTWLAVEGRSAVEIRDVLGHTQTSMTDRYMRDATIVRSGRFGAPFPELPGESYSNRSGRFGGSRSSQKQAVLSGVDGTRIGSQSNDSESLQTPIVPPETIRDKSTPQLATTRVDVSGVDEERLESRMLDADLAGNRTLALAYARRLERLRALKAGGNVVAFPARRT